MKQFFIISMLLTSAAATNAQNVGIGTGTPQARLHVDLGDVLFSGSATLPPAPSTSPPPVEGQGTRMMWYPQKAAFRAGYVDGVNWNKDSTGLYSAAMGYNVKAKGFGAVALGYGTNAFGTNTTAIGTFSEALGNASVAMGSSLVAKAYGATAVGMINDTADTPNPNFAAPTDRLFQIGNGSFSPVSRSNALTVLRNGNVGIGVLAPAQKLEVSGNAQISGTIQTANLQITGGTPAAGKVLTSDAAGNASWQQPVNTAAAGTAFFSVHPTSPGTTVGNNGSVTIPFVDNQSGGMDNGSNFNNTTHVFTAPSAGLYHFSYSVRLVAASAATQNGVITLHLMVGSSLKRRTSLPVVVGTTVNGIAFGDNAIIPLQSGDQISVIFTQSTGISLDLWNTDNTHFGGYKVY